MYGLSINHKTERRKGLIDLNAKRVSQELNFQLKLF